MFLRGSRNEPFELKPLNSFFGAARIRPTRLDPLPAPETEPGLSQDSTFFQMLQRRRCDLFIDSPKARRLSRRHREIRHLLEISPDSRTSIVRDVAAHSSATAGSQRFTGLAIAALEVFERHRRVCR